jgi:hypothetical protein
LYKRGKDKFNTKLWLRSMRGRSQYLHKDDTKVSKVWGSHSRDYGECILFLHSVLRLLVHNYVEEWCLLGCYAVWLL